MAEEKRLQTILAHAGVASRREAANVIESGRVKVDGQVVSERGYRLDPQKHSIEVDSKQIGKEKKRYYILYKPAGYLSTVKDTHDRRKVTDIFHKVDERVYPVGRLDKDTTGVIIVTNDGDLSYKLSHPSFEIDKIYVAEVKEPLSPQEINQLQKGIDIDGKRTSPCRVSLHKEYASRVAYKVKIHEGRNRQVRRMFLALDKKVIDLKRVKYAFLTLKGLEEGEYRSLTGVEVEKLYKL